MQRIEPKQPYRRGDKVIYQGHTYYWGTRVGARRLLSLAPNGTGIMISESAVGSTIFPAPIEGRYEMHQAIRWEHSSIRNIRIRLYVLQINLNAWIGGLSARLGKVSRSMPLQVGSHCSPSEKLAIAHLLSVVINDLASYSQTSRHARRMATETTQLLLQGLPSEYTTEFKIPDEAVAQ